MKNKYNFIVLFIIGVVLINLEFALYTISNLFGVMSIVIITPLILLSVVAMNHYEYHGEWKIYLLSFLLLIIYGQYANVYEVFIVIIGIIFVWFYRNYIIDLHKTDLLIGIFISYFVLFTAITIYFIFVYNLNVDLTIVFFINTLVGTSLNTIITAIVLFVFTKDLGENDHF